MSDKQPKGSWWNLIDEPWLPCTYDDGRFAELSLRGLFHDAPHIRELSGDLPQQGIALLRLALAVMYRAFCDAAQDMTHRQMLRLWKGMWGKGGFDLDPIDSYLDEWHDRFWLIDQEHPFYQVPGLEYTGKEFDPIREMIPDVPKERKFLFSMRSRDSLKSLGAAQTSRYLVFLQAYDTAGIKTPVEGNTHINRGKVYAPKGKVGTGWLGAIGSVSVEGENLFQTLMMNWVLYLGDTADVRLLGNEDDLPPWEYDEPAPVDIDERIGFEGPVDALTWQSRRVRLVASPDGPDIIGLVNCYGDVLAAYNTNDCEMMTAWRRSIPQQKKLGLAAPPLMPVAHDASKALWRGLAPILVADEAADLRPGVIRWMEELRAEGCLENGEHVLAAATIHAQGMTYGTQSSVYETGVDDALRLSTALFRHDYPAIGTVCKVVDDTDLAVRALANFVRNLRASAGDKSSGNTSRNASEQVREEAYARLDGLFRDRLAGFTENENYESYGQAWRDDVHRMLLSIGQDYFAESDVPSFGRHDAGVMGEMTAMRAQAIFRASLNKALGTLPVMDREPLDSDDDAGRPNEKGN